MHDAVLYIIHGVGITWSGRGPAWQARGPAWQVRPRLWPVRPAWQAGWPTAALTVWIDLHKVLFLRSYSITSRASAIYISTPIHTTVLLVKWFSTLMTILKSQFHFSSYTVHFWNILDEQNIGCHWCRPVTCQLVDSMRQTNGPLIERIKCCFKSCSNSILCQKRKIIISGPFIF